MRAISLLFLLCVFLLPGCSDMNIPNPFETSTASGTEVYFDQFPDVPIPKDLTVDTKRSLVSVTPDGTKTGLLTVEGRVDKPSLANAMILNMSNQGWTMRGATIGNKTMHLFEKDSRFAVLYYYDQTVTAAMEIWILTRLAEGVMPTMGAGNTSTTPDHPSFNLSPNASSGSSRGGVTQQGLSQ